MQHIVTILIAILIFCIIVVIHEFGHFIAAKLNRIQVNQFAVGMGPKLLHFQKGETEYSLRLFPCWRILCHGGRRSVQRQSERI